ncbi:hypothetical protein ABTM44_18390, partial [Acinetobacter baumannii]
MKPLGPVPAGFATRGPDLLIGGVRAAELASRAGQTPRFVYDGAMIAARVAAVRAAMPQGLGLHYAVKANPFAPLLA